MLLSRLFSYITGFCLGDEKGFCGDFQFCCFGGRSGGEGDKGWGFGRKGKRRRGIFGNGCMEWSLIGSDDAGR